MSNWRFISIYRSLSYPLRSYFEVCKRYQLKLKFRSGRKVSQKPVIKLRLRIIKLLLWSIAKQKMLLLKVQTARRNQKKRKKVCILNELNKEGQILLLASNRSYFFISYLHEISQLKIVIFPRSKLDSIARIIVQVICDKISKMPC